MAEWKLCSDKGLSALPAAISERCHRYGDGRLFSLIIGNCECVSVPAQGYSNIKDTCQRKPVLWNLMSSTTTVEMHGLMFTVHSQAPHRWESSAQLMRTSSCSRKGPEGKELWQKICLTVSAWQKKKAYVRSVELRRTERDKKKKKKKISDIVHGGMFGARMWCYHSDGISPWRGPGRCAAGRETWSRLIALSWMTCSCLQLKAAPKPRDRCSVTSALFPSFPTDVASQSRFVLWWDEYDSWKTCFTHFHINYIIIIAT